jgi:hypothetical protein
MGWEHGWTLGILEICGGCVFLLVYGLGSVARDDLYHPCLRRKNILSVHGVDRFPLYPLSNAQLVEGKNVPFQAMPTSIQCIRVCMFVRRFPSSCTPSGHCSPKGFSPLSLSLRHEPECQLCTGGAQSRLALARVLSEPTLLPWAHNNGGGGTKAKNGEKTN